MTIPKPNYNPPFNVTRASHAVLHVKDLGKSRAFYVDLIGFIVSDEDKDAIYLRGVAEACHHSLVLKRAATAEAERVGMRCFTEEDLEKAKRYFEKAWPAGAMGGAAVSGQNAACERSARLCRSNSAPPWRPSRVSWSSFEHHHGAVPQRIDHFQLLVPDVQRQLEFYMGLGFRLSEYIAADGSDDPLFVFLQRKGNPHDIVFAPGAGPRLHHAAFSIPESYLFFYVCDLAFNMGFAENIEFGPGRHGPGHALFVYMRDPDGHRIELFNTHYQCIDIEEEPVRWDASRAGARRWQLPARAQWFAAGEPLCRRRAARAGGQGQPDDARTLRRLPRM